MGAFAQSGKNSNKTFAITGDGANDYIWMNIRQVDLSSGQVTNTVFERSKTGYIMTDVQSKRVNQPGLHCKQQYFRFYRLPDRNVGGCGGLRPERQ